MRSSAARVTGPLCAWRAVTMTFDGPYGAENPETFRDYALWARFRETRSGASVTLAGFFAADGAAADTSAIGGRSWRLLFTPPVEGEWRYEIAFRTAPDLAAAPSDVALAAPSAGHMDGAEGRLLIGPPPARQNGEGDLAGLAALGPVAWTKDGHLFTHAGLDAPDIRRDPEAPFLADEEFSRDEDGPHASASGAPSQWRPEDPLWGGGAGRGVIGRVNQMAEAGATTLLAKPFGASADAPQTALIWREPGVIHGARLARWDLAFGQAERRGLVVRLDLRGLRDSEATRMDPTLQRIAIRELAARLAHRTGFYWAPGAADDAALISAFDGHRRALAEIEEERPIRVVAGPGAEAAAAAGRARRREVAAARAEERARSAAAEAVRAAEKSARNEAGARAAQAPPTQPDLGAPDHGETAAKPRSTRPGSVSEPQDRDAPPSPRGDMRDERPTAEASTEARAEAGAEAGSEAAAGAAQRARPVGDAPHADGRRTVASAPPGGAAHRLERRMKSLFGALTALRNAPQGAAGEGAPPPAAAGERTQPNAPAQTPRPAPQDEPEMEAAQQQLMHELAATEALLMGGDFVGEDEFDDRFGEVDPERAGSPPETAQPPAHETATEARRAAVLRDIALARAEGLASEHAPGSAIAGAPPLAPAPPEPTLPPSAQAESGGEADMAMRLYAAAPTGEAKAAAPLDPMAGVGVDALAPTGDAAATLIVRLGGPDADAARHVTLKIIEKAPPFGAPSTGPNLWEGSAAPLERIAVFTDLSAAMSAARGGALAELTALSAQSGGETLKWWRFALTPSAAPSSGEKWRDLMARRRRLARGQAEPQDAGAALQADDAEDDAPPLRLAALEIVDRQLDYALARVAAAEDGVAELPARLVAGRDLVIRPMLEGARAADVGTISIALADPSGLRLATAEAVAEAARRQCAASLTGLVLEPGAWRLTISAAQSNAGESPPLLTTELRLIIA